MHRQLKVNDVWTTAEGKAIPIRNMASSHLLSTIHFIERGRFQRVADAALRQHEEPLNNETISYYMMWPIQYEALVAEAVRRNLIYRPIEKVETSTSMVKSFRELTKNG
jgi:hypothetical protein